MRSGRVTSSLSGQAKSCPSTAFFFQLRRRSIELALTGEPLPAIHHAGDGLRSGAVNAGETFEMQATATAGESTYAGIVRLVTAAQTAKAPFIRMADKYALLLLPITLVVAGGAWIASGDALRGLADLVASTPCPLILAAPGSLSSRSIPRSTAGHSH